MKNVKVIGFLVVLLTALLLFPEDGFAGSNEPTEGIPANDPSFGSSSQTNEMQIQSTLYLKSPKVSISKQSGDSVSLSGVTEAYTSVNTIGVKLFLQRWDASSGRWGDVTYLGDFYDNYSTYVSGDGVVGNLTRGYYRTRGVHYVYEGSIKEEENSASTYIYID
jgi:hypothetical protein